MDYLRDNTVRPSIEQGSLPIRLFLLDAVDIERGRQLQKVLRKKSPTNMENESFWNIIKPIIAVSQFFGNFPISGLYKSKPDEYVFKFPSFITGYSVMIISLIGIGIAATFNEVIHSTKDEFFLKFWYTVFYGYNFLVLLIIFFKTPSWIKLQMNWRRVEEKLDNFHQTKFRLRFKLRTISLIMFFLASFETIYWYKNLISETSAEDVLNFMSERYLSLFSSVDGSLNNYKIFVGTIGIIISAIGTFTWNFCDLLIIMVSIGLSERYKHFNEIVCLKISNDPTERINWRKIKNKYVIMNELVKEAENIVSPLILISCCMNVYQICEHLSEVIRSVKTESKISIYYFWSLSLLIFRTMAVVLSAAKIDNENKHALSIFTRCHPSVFIIEVIWIQQQLSIDEVSFTAMKIFSITRKFILTIAGTIITYEIVYMQLRAHY